ncbi:MAG: AAA family ATPase [Candidatus Nomurabacteria bacterium]
MPNTITTPEEYFSLFPGSRYRYIHDSIANTVTQGNNVLDKTFNESGYGVFYAVNGFPLTGRMIEENLSFLNVVFVDIDFSPTLPQEEVTALIQEKRMLADEAGLPSPTIIVRTKKGAHMIWLFPAPLEATEENKIKCRDIQRRLVHFYGGDKNAMDLARILRLPFTKHLKDPNNPFDVTILAYNPDESERCTIDELDKLIPKYSAVEISSNKIPVKEILAKGVKIGEGLRHMAIAQVSGFVLSGAKTPEQITIARLALYGWDRTIVKSPEPFETRKKELDNTFNGLWGKESRKKTLGGTLEENISVEKIVSTKPRLWSIGDILNNDFGEEDWLVDHLIPKQGITALSGNPGEGKTWVCIHIALSMSRETSVFGKYKTTKGAVLIIDEEDHLRLLKKRLELLGTNDTDNIFYLSQSGIKVDDENVLEMLVDIIKEKNIVLVILDSLVRVHGQEENEAKGMAKVFDGLKKVITAGSSILFTHHHRKEKGYGSPNGQSMRGSSDILAVVDCHITVEKKKDEENRLIIRQTKLRQDEALKPFEINIINGEHGPSGFEYVGDFDEKKMKVEEVAAAVSLLLADGMKSREQLHEILTDDFGKTAIDDGIKLAKESGKIEKVPSDEVPKADRKKSHYRLPRENDSEQVELPVFSTYIEDRKQEDESLFDNQEPAF